MNLWADFKHLCVQTFISLDQTLNVLASWVFFFWAASGAWADETLSCRSYRAWRDKKIAGRITMPIIDFLFRWQKLRPDAIGHCHSAYLNEREKYNHPPEMR